MSTTEPINYQAVLRDLRSRRAALETAIEVLEQLENQGALANSASLLQPREASAPADSGAAGAPSKPPTDQSKQAASSDVRSDTFFGLSISQAARKLLLMVKRPQSTKAICDALLKGGLLTTSGSFYGTVYGSLHRLDDFVLVGKEWALAEWYPNRPKKKEE